MNLREKLLSMGRNSIALKISGEESYRRGATRFGGQPDVPPGFRWPVYQGENYSHVVDKWPLSFLLQINCQDLAPYDTEYLLPDRGLLSFFCEMSTYHDGNSLLDRGCFRVYWFEELSALSAAAYPEELGERLRFSMEKMRLIRKTCYPSWDDFRREFPGEYDETAFRLEVKELTGEDRTNWTESSRLLGWPDENSFYYSMFSQCDLLTQGYELAWNRIPENVLRRAKESAQNRWTLLLQLEGEEYNTFRCFLGEKNIYIYISNEDLKARCFERAWMMRRYSHISQEIQVDTEG